jgi:hypothetical protein
MTPVIALILANTLMSISEPESKPTDINFWIGVWNIDSYTPQPDGTLKEQKNAGTNTIKRIHNDLIVHESFDGPGLKGESWTAFAPGIKQFRQTWVDNSGSYLTFQGGKVGEEFILNQLLPNDTMRMRFTEIKEDSFTWIWEMKKGDTYELKWKVIYTRKK